MIAKRLISPLSIKHIQQKGGKTMISSKIKELIAFLRTDPAKPILRVYKGEMPLRELVLMSPEEKSIAIMLRRLKHFLDEENN